MKIWYSPYQLYPKNSLNARTGRVFRKGALLRVQFDGGAALQVGYADLCPLPSFGDRPLEIELEGLKKDQLSTLSRRSIEHARKDAEARSAGKSLYNEVRIKNHFLISDLLGFDLARIPLLQGQRFTEFKVKLGRDLVLETEMLKAFVSALAPECKVRLDFNNGLNEKYFIQWLADNLAWLEPHLDFIEDPFSYQREAWKAVQDRFRISLAVDFLPTRFDPELDGADIVVVKPALQEVTKILQRTPAPEKRFVFTHYMDFPLGQMAALVEAQQAILHELMAGEDSRILHCGLQHHEVYEGFTFQDQIRNDGPFIVPPDGPGYGFGALLDRQEWRVLL